MDIPKSTVKDQTPTRENRRTPRVTNWLHAFIRKVTGAPNKDIAQIETIMRQDIFHSTLDWQTQDQLTEAAREAYSLLQDNRELYELTSPPPESHQV